MDRATLCSVIRSMPVMVTRAGVTHSLPGFIVASMVLALAGFGQPASADTNLPSPSDTVTFNKDIAPIVFEHCASCHRPGEVAPFSLLTYEDVKSRASMVAAVTAERIMPPWLPEPGYGEFSGNRRLMDEQIDVIQRWVEEGAVEGDPSDRPPAPEWPEGWQLGEPDMVIEMQEPYTLRADVGEKFRNFVMPNPVQTARYVRAVELRPGNPRIVHHAQMLIDRTPSSRELDEDDREPGYEGMFTASQAHSPNGFFLGWTPGKVSFGGVEGNSWRLEPNTDLVLELHLRPTSQPEVIGATVGLYFTAQPPTRSPFLLRLGSNTIDIPAGKKDYTIQDTYVLPVDVDVFSVYPHAHYLAKEMLGYATLPDGTTKWLIRINEWDFNWQDAYRFAEPMFLPKGTTLVMQYTYDNSVDNVRNPHRPPQHVLYGPKSSDEMGDLWIQVFLRNRSDRAVLASDFGRKNLQLQIAGYQQMVRIDPDFAAAHQNLGAAYQSLGRLDQAINHYRQALRVEPDNAGAHNNLASALQTMDELDEAMSHYGEALRVNPDNAEAHNNLGTLLAAQGKLDEAVTQYREALRVNKDFADAHFNLGTGLVVQGKLDEAINHYGQALRVDPDQPQAHNNLGSALQAQGRLGEAVSHYRRAVQLDGDLAAGHYNLGSALQAQGRLDEAISHYRRALQLNDELTAAHNSLGTALATQGKLDEAISGYLRVLELKPDDARARYNLGVALRSQLEMAWTLATHPIAEARDPDAAVRLAERVVGLTGSRDPAVLDVLAAAYAAAGRFELAEATVQTAIGLATAARADQLAGELRARLDLYKQAKPYRETGPSDVK